MIDTPHMPVHGDRILILRWEWLLEILSGRKDLEIRGRYIRPGRIYLGCKKRIYGVADLGEPVKISNMTVWRNLMPRHRWNIDVLPYRTTYAFPLSGVQVLCGVPFEHPCGAVSIVRFRSCTHIDACVASR